jgi:4-hydroxy-tetrahydrodipicolinate reductase
MGIKLVVIGAAGRMGSRILSLAADFGQFDIVDAVDRPGHPDIGKSLIAVTNSSSAEILLSDTCRAVDADVAIDFSLPEASEQTADFCLANGIALVCGTTGLTEQQRDKLRDASRKIPILYATNMSVGMNALFSLAGKVASMLGDDYDIEIVEQHHRFKKDAPSGTAMTLAENICRATERDFPESLVHGRAGTDAQRQKGDIGVHAVRAGDITGIHSVIFGTPGETIILNHTANSRDTFVRGALRAAQWLVGKPPALYSMADVLGIDIK